MISSKIDSLINHPSQKWIATALSWLGYLAGLLLFPALAPLSSIQLYPLAALPVVVTAWMCGLRWALGASLLSILLHAGARLLYPSDIHSPRAMVINHLIEFAILSILGLLVGYLQDLRKETEGSLQQLEKNSAKLSRFSGLLETINVFSTDLLDTQDWDQKLPQLIQELGRASGVDHAFLLVLENGGENLQSIRQFHFRTPNLSPAQNADRRLNGSALPSDLYTWIQSTEKGAVYLGSISSLKPETRIFLNCLPTGIYAVFPILSNHEPWGFLGFEKKADLAPWDQIELDAFRIIVQTLSSTVHRKIIEDSLVRRAKEFETLHRTSTDLSSSSQLETGINSVLAQILDLVPAYDTNIYLYTQGELIFYTSLGLNNQQSLPYTHPQEMELSHRVAVEKEDLIIPDLKHHADFNGEQLADDQALISLSLVAAGDVIGVLNIWFREKAHFNEEELRLLRLLADQAAAAILNNQFLSIEREQRILAESLRKAAEQLTTNLELRPVLENILEQVLRLVSAKDAHIFLYQGRELSLGAVKYADSDSRLPIADPREDGLTFSVAHSGERILVPDIREHPIFEDAPGTWEGSIIGLPLIFHGQVLGVMNVAFSRPHAFNEQTLRLLDVLSNQASIAIHNARTYEGERDQRRLAEALQNTGRALQSSLELETVLDQILASIETVIPYDSVNLMLVEKGRAEVVRRQGYQDLHPELLSAISETPIAINEFSTLRTMMQTRAPLIISNTKTDPRWVDTKSSSIIILSWAGAPIIDENQVIGFLSLNKTEPDFYHPEHAERLSTFAGQAAIALRHARLFEQIQENARALGALHQATTTSVSTLKLDDLLRKILQGALEAIPSGKRGAIYLVNDHGSALTNQACSGFEDPPPESYSLQENGELIVRAYQENQALLIPLSEENRLQQPGRGTQPPTRLHLRMAAPLPAQDRMLGVILLEASQGEIFTQEDLEILTSIAATTANAVRNAQLHAEIQAKAVTDSLTDIFNRRGLDQWGQYEFDRARRFDRPLSVIFFDLDHFKEVNDTHGHEIGDLVLKQLVSRCQQVIRTVDIFARFGGEEFVVILPETDLELALQVAERMREAVAAEPFEIHSISIQMSISLGVTTLSPSVKELNVLINAADQYMYQAKQSGRNTVAFPSH